MSRNSTFAFSSFLWLSHMPHYKSVCILLQPGYFKFFLLFYELIYLDGFGIEFYYFSFLIVSQIAPALMRMYAHLTEMGTLPPTEYNAISLLLKQGIDQIELSSYRPISLLIQI